MDSSSTLMPADLFNALPDGVVVVDTEGRMLEVNQALCRMFGHSAEDLRGEPIEVLIPEPLRAAHRRHVARYADQPHVRPMGVGLELQGLRSDGSAFPVEISLSPLETPDRRVFLAAVRDASEQRRMRNFSAGALRAAEEERRRIAREIHDDSMQRLATTLVQLGLLESRLGGEERQLAGAVRDEVRDIAESLRLIARGLRPPELDDAGLVPAVRAHARGLRKVLDVDVQAGDGPVDHIVDGDAELAIYRIIQEALSNVVRHAGATRARVSLASSDDVLVARVEDDGEGFDVESVRRRGLGLGLLGMSERAAMIGAVLEVRSSTGEGTTVEVRVPVQVLERA